MYDLNQMIVVLQGEAVNLVQKSQFKGAISILFPRRDLEYSAVTFAGEPCSVELTEIVNFWKSEVEKVTMSDMELFISANRKWAEGCKSDGVITIQGLIGDEFQVFSTDKRLDRIVMLVDHRGYLEPMRFSSKLTYLDDGSVKAGPWSPEFLEVLSPEDPDRKTVSYIPRNSRGWWKNIAAPKSTGIYNLDSSVGFVNPNEAITEAGDTAWGPEECWPSVVVMSDWYGVPRIFVQNKECCYEYNGLLNPTVVIVAPNEKRAVGRPKTKKASSPHLN
jgi:hypothetical protein